MQIASNTNSHRPDDRDHNSGWNASSDGTLERRERGNDLDRPGPTPENGSERGQAFVFNGVE